jgi:excisionase family DNA binding protein
MLSVKATAERLHVSVNTIYALCAERKLRHVRVGVGRGKVCVPEDAIAEYVRCRTVEADGAKPPPPRVFTH